MAGTPRRSDAPRADAQAERDAATSLGAPLLEIEAASVRFAGAAYPALGAVDLRVAAGEIVCVLGPSGSGKSTLLRAVAGLQALDSGRVRLEGRDQAGVPAHRRGVGLMFQDHQLFPQRDVGGNIAFGPRMHGATRGEQHTRVAELLRLVGLPDAAGAPSARSPAVNSSGSPWPAPWRPALACSCSTSRSASWTGACASASWSNCGNSSARWGRRCWR